MADIRQASPIMSGSGSIEVTPGDVYEPQTPTLTVGTIMSSSIALSCNAVSDPGIVSSGVATYKFEGKLSSSGTWTTIQNTSSRSTTYSGLSASTNYDVRVSAFDYAGNQSGFDTQTGVVTQSVGGNEKLVPVASTTNGSALQTWLDDPNNNVQDGDTILLPNGSYTWTTGVITTKQIIIRAQNYTPTPAGQYQGVDRAGATSRNVTIRNNCPTNIGGVPQGLFKFTSGNTAHCGLGGIAVLHSNTGTAPYHVRFEGAGSKVPLIFDCYFEMGFRNIQDSTTPHFFDLYCRGGVIWNCVLSGTGRDPDGTTGEGNAVIKSPYPLWNTPSTMGNLDDGTNNFYAEDCTFEDFGLFVDIDNHGRFVARRCIYDCCWGETHGQTSLAGGRHFEFYDNSFRSTRSSKNDPGGYVWARSGTGIMTRNEIRRSESTGYNQGGNLKAIFFCEGDGQGRGPTGDPSINDFGNAEDPGWGHNGSSNILDPVYIWNQSGDNPYYYSIASEWAGQVQVGTEIIITQTNDETGRKPGYVEFTYPHPFRSAV